MIQFDISIDDAAANIMMYRLGSMEKIGTALRAPMTQATALVQTEMKIYPPQAPESRYRRTGTLKRNWARRVEPIYGGVVGIVHNITEYKKWVQSERYQTALHKSRGWQTEVMVMTDKQREVQYLIDQAVKRIVEGR